MPFAASQPEVTTEDFRPLSYDAAFGLTVLDQRLLPHEEKYIGCASSQEVINAIKDMAVRGAPCIGLAGAWACCLAAKEEGENSKNILQKFALIQAARPTAVNLAKAVNRMKECLLTKGAVALEAEAQAMYEEDKQMCLNMSSHGLTVLPNKSEFKILTHCNTGSLATAGIGTALGTIKLLAQHKSKVHVYATETRPYLQGSRLTIWELQKAKIPCTLLPDSAAAFLLKTQKIDAVFVGADRIVANGDTANKIGTYMLALAAKQNGVPFYVVAPSTSIDLSLPSGEQIEIEMREAAEVSEIKGHLIAPAATQVYNPSFDITPGNLISAFITEKGVFSAEKLVGLK